MVYPPVSCSWLVVDSIISTSHPRDLHGGNHHSTWIHGSSTLVVDTTSCCCPSLLTYTVCGVWLSPYSLCESVHSIWSSGDVHDGGITSIGHLVDVHGSDDIQYLDLRDPVHGV